MTEPKAPDFVAIGSIIIDDIVDPYGHSNMGVLGGGGSHAIIGMRAWGQRTALVSVIGEGFPETARQQLTALADTRGIVERSVPQPRAWQLFEPDGLRNEVFRTDFQTFLQISVRPDEYPNEFAAAQGVYLQASTAAEAAAWVQRLKALNPEVVILWEPWEVFYKPDNLPDFRRVAPLFDIISPNTAEAGWLLGETQPERQATLLFECGVRCLALRLGAAGSLVGTAEQIYYIPAVPVHVIDETGAGNSYGGGFVVGYVQSGGDPLTAGRYGAVSATFALGQLGLPVASDDWQAVARQRLTLLLSDTETW